MFLKAGNIPYQKNGVASVGDALDDIYENGGGGGSPTGSFKDQAGGVAGTYGAIVGVIDGVNKEFTVSNGSYISGSLTINLNGKLEFPGNDWVETSPATGVFTFVEAPLIGETFLAEYNDIAIYVANPPAVSTPALELVETITISNDAEIIFTNLGDGDDIFEFRGVKMSIDADFLYMQVSTDNGVSFISSNYGWMVSRQTWSTGTASGNYSSGGTASFIRLARDTMGNDTGEYFSGQVFAENPSSNYRKVIRNSTGYFESTGAFANVWGKGVWNQDTPYNAIRFYSGQQGGNIASGTISHYKQQITI